MRSLAALFICTSVLLSGCGLGETAATASLQAEQAARLQQQTEQLKQQIEAANTQSQKRLEQGY
jgi:cell division protein ZapA (FtsZ GTPase activity inhibitor)